MVLCSKAVFIVGAKRTPFCKYGGSMRELPASYAFAAAAKNALATARLSPTAVDSTVVGNVNFLSQCDGGKTPRYCGTYSGVPLDRPALGVNMTCGTGIQAVITGATDMLTNVAEVALVGGTEIMSAQPYLVRTRFGTTLGSKLLFEDYISRQALDSYTGKTLQAMAEDVAKKFGVSGKDADQFTLQSWLRYRSAKQSGAFKDQVTPVTVTVKKNEVEVTEDELHHTVETLEDLEQSTAITEGDVVTTRSSTTPSDGAAALLLATESAVAAHNLTPLARVAGWARTGVEPGQPGLGAAEAAKHILKAAGMTVANVDVIELNETFAAETVAACRSLDLDPSSINLQGGALVLGHPVAATGSRMLVHLVHQLRLGLTKTGPGLAENIEQLFLPLFAGGEVAHIENTLTQMQKFI